MGVYINGMKMPRSCYDCKLDLRTDVCSAFLEWKKEHPYSIKGYDRLPNCPMVEVPEPHGRLIEAPDVSEYEVLDEDTGTREISLLSLMECHRMVKEAKTIIEAEGE